MFSERSDKTKQTWKKHDPDAQHTYITLHAHTHSFSHKNTHSHRNMKPHVNTHKHTCI